MKALPTSTSGLINPKGHGSCEMRRSNELRQYHATPLFAVGLLPGYCRVPRAIRCPDWTYQI